MVEIIRRLPIMALVLLLAACNAIPVPDTLVVTVQPRPAAQEPAAQPPVAQPTVVPPAKPPTAAAEPRTDLFFARPEGTRGAAIAYDLATGHERFALPAGMFSADGTRYYAAEIQGDDTSLSSYNPFTGEKEICFQPLGGRWTLSGVGPTGRWVALTRIPTDDEKQTWIKAGEWKTDVEIFDTQEARLVHVMHLDGNFEVETVSASGDALFLIQHLPAVNPDHYVIRLYDLSREALIADPLRSKGPDEVMAGLAWDGVASTDGKWLLTLYLSTRRNTAFVHTLDLVNRFPVCVDLPSGQGDFAQLKYYTLTVAPSNMRLYAANAALGVVAEVDLSQYRVVRTTHFTPSARAVTEPYLRPEIPASRSLLSQDGQLLYFTDGQDVWAYDTAAHQVSGPYVTHAQVTGLGVSRDGRRLLVARQGQDVLVFDTGTGEVVSGN